MNDRAHPPSEEPSDRPERGEVSALLEELAATPERELREAWERGLSPGAVVGRFELLREIGRGGFGVVYEARDRELGRLVAFKAIRPGNRSLAELRQRWLQREAEAAAQLNHRNIVTLHDFGRAESGPYLILELLHGETLEARLEHGALPTAEALAVAASVARALAHAHAAGVLHRDLKPSNVFACEDGTVKVLDFGLAQILGTSGLRGGGTPAYMAPEQWRGGPEDARTDLFSLGAVLFALLAGHSPFRLVEGRSTALDDGPVPPLTAPGVPPPVAALVSRLLSKDPAGRPGSAQEVLERLDAAERELASDTAPRRRRSIRRRLVLVGAAVALALAVAGREILQELRQEAAPGPGERVVVSVADFANDTGERDLDGLSGMLITSLEQSRRLDVLTRSRMLDLARQLGRGEATRVDEPLGRAVAREARAHALLLGTIRRFDGVYAIDLQALDPEKNAYLFTLKEQGEGKKSIPALLDRLSERTRRALRESAAEVQASRLDVASAVTADLEAYRHYFLGQQCIDGISKVVDCTREFRRAVEIDPRFALAHWMIAYTGEFRGAPFAEQRASIAEALRWIDRVPWKEGRLVRAWAAHLDGNDEASLALYREVMEAHPQDKQPAYLAGDLLFHRGDAKEALPLLEKALALDAGAQIQVLRAHVAEALAQAGRGAEAVARAREWARDGSPAGHEILSIALAMSGDAQGAIAAADEALARGGGSDARHQLVAPLFATGDLARAERELRLLADESLPPQIRGGALATLAHLRATQGRRAEGRAFLEDARRALVGWDPAKLAAEEAQWRAAEGDSAGARALADKAVEANPRSGAQLGLLLALAGDVAGAERLVADFRAGPGKDQRGEASERSRRLADAVLRWKRGDARGAYEALPRFEAPTPGFAFIAGQMAFDAGDWEHAVEWLERGGRLVGDVGIRSWAYPRSLQLLALAHERLGEPDRALARLDQLLVLWKGADPGLPLLAEARTLRTRLADEVRRAAASQRRAAQ